MSCLHGKTDTCLGEDVRRGAGSCFIVCAVPLLIPGVTLTAVAFEDETGFSRYSAVHVFGMVLLTLAIVTFIIGIGLSVRTHSRITPDDFLQTISTHRKSSNCDNLDTAFTSKSSRHPLKVKGVPPMSNSDISHVNYFIQNNHNRALDQPATFTHGFRKLSGSHQTDGKENPTSRQILASDSSSDESYDSDDCSYGSYSITEDVTEAQSPVALTIEPHNEAIKQCDKRPLDSKPRIVRKPGFVYFKTAFVQSLNVSSNNFFHYSADDIASELSELYNNKIKQPLQSEKPLSEIIEIENEAFQRNAENMKFRRNAENEVFHSQRSAIHSGDASQFETFVISNPTLEIKTQENKSGVRQRLHGLSSDDVLISSEISMSPDIVVIPIETHHLQLLTTPEENVASSNSSVFSATRESTTKINNIKNNTNNYNSSWRLQLNHHKSLIRSPYATRPYSFPLGGRLYGPTGASVRKQSRQKLSVRTNSRQGGRCSDRIVVPMTILNSVIVTPVCYVKL